MPSSSSIEADGENCREGEDVHQIYTMPLVATGQKPKKAKIVRYFICENFVKLHLATGHAFLIDLEYLDEISKFNWSVYDDYIYRVKMIDGKRNIKIRLHRQIMRAESGQIVDHINGNTFDNRKENLRFCTIQQNQKNRKKREAYKASSKYKGVSKHGKKWRVSITVNYHRHLLGVYDTQEQAAEVYNKASLKLHGQFGRLNEIEVTSV